MVVKFWCCFVNYKAVTAQSFTYHHNLGHGNALRNASLRCFISCHNKINISILVVIRIQGPCPLSSGLGPRFIVDDPSDANIQSKFENTTLYLSCCWWCFGKLLILFHAFGWGPTSTLFSSKLNHFTKLEWWTLKRNFSRRFFVAMETKFVPNVCQSS